MNITKIEKDRLGAYVAFPRSQYKGITLEGCPLPEEGDFKARKVEVPTMGEVTMIEQTQWPGRTMQLFEPASEKQFDDYLSKLLAMNETPAYVEGDTSFMVLFQGSREKVFVTQENHLQVDKEICVARDQAARWWKMYGKLRIKN